MIKSTLNERTVCRDMITDMQVMCEKLGDLITVALRVSVLNLQKSIYLTSNIYQSQSSGERYVKEHSALLKLCFTDLVFVDPSVTERWPPELIPAYRQSARR